MNHSVFPLWVFVAVALAIAVTGFALAQVAKGSGMVFVLAVSLGWVAYVQVRQRRMMK